MSFWRFSVFKDWMIMNAKANKQDPDRVLYSTPSDLDLYRLYMSISTDNDMHNVKYYLPVFRIAKQLIDEQF